MDTNHSEIDVLWPNDSEEFSLRGDKRLVNTSVFVNTTILEKGTIRFRYTSWWTGILRNVDSVESIQREEFEEKRGEKGWEGSREFL